MDCELCGEREASKVAIIENIEMNVCDKCAKFGKVVREIKTKERQKEKQKKKMKAIIKEEVIVDDYLERIKNAREKNNLTIADFASLLNEKVSYLKRIEKGKTIPSEKLARKIERLLKIKLIEEREVKEERVKPIKEKDITLGDIAEVK